jgi:peptidoglycan/xylan/chitin deacetylase (PgdA/CDA1 family)
LSYSKSRNSVMDLAAQAFWHIPGRFGLASVFGPSYSLRCVVFHHIGNEESPFTRGMNVRATVQEFEGALKFLTTHYSPVRLDDVLAAAPGHPLPRRAVLVTFDDAYASVVEVAAPLCRKYGVPAVFFVNAAFLDNQCLAPDNLICYVANVHGMEKVNAAVRAAHLDKIVELRSLSEVFGNFLPSLTLAERKEFLEALVQSAGVDERQLAAKAALYLSKEQLRTLAAFDFEIGNHTYTHVHCRGLAQSEFAQEIDRNKSELETASGVKVRSFSQPYGSSKDLTCELASHLENSGHEAIFLSESVANPEGFDRLRLNRVNTRTDSDDWLFFDLEVLPRVRLTRNRLFRSSKPTAVGQALDSKIN